MLVTACELIFVVCRPGQTDGRETYPAGTPVTPCPLGADDDSRSLLQRINELQKRDGIPYRAIVLGGKQRVVAAAQLKTQGSARDTRSTATNQTRPT